MSILEELRSEKAWETFREYKISRGQLTKKEMTDLDLFIMEKRYLKPLVLGIPEKKVLSKISTAKKRTVYCFEEDVTWNLKLLAHLLYRYDDQLSANCYSFRRSVTAKTAFTKICHIPDIECKYVLKADISNYFNSIPVEQLLMVLQKEISDDPELLAFFKTLLNDDHCLYEGEVIREPQGAMAGVPLASFFANFYLKDLDLFFEEKGIDYFRYSDDILIFGDSMEKIREYYELLVSFLQDKGLKINEKKLGFFGPEEGFEFLGFRYLKGVIDLSAVTIDKMKGKLSRKARALYRKRELKGLTFEKAAIMMIRCFDARFYDLTGDNEYTWTRFYFPVINSSEGLKIIDRYFVEQLRYLSSGRHYKGNYKVSYEQLKKLGYTSLVHEYYGWKEDNRRLKEMNSSKGNTGDYE